MQGWIKLHRKLVDNPIITRPELLQLFIYCLLCANHEPNKTLWGTHEREVKRGQFITGRFQLATALKCKPITIYKRLLLLCKMGFLNTESNNKNTLVTVVNYEVYQCLDTENNTNNNNKVTTNEQQSNTNKNDKNNKKIIYAEFVTLKPSEYETLVDKFGEETTKDKIEALNLWKGSKGKKTHSDYLTILNWDRQDKKKAEQQKKPEARYTKGFNPDEYRL